MCEVNTVDRSVNLNTEYIGKVVAIVLVVEKSVRELTSNLVAINV